MLRVVPSCDPLRVEAGPHSIIDHHMLAAGKTDPAMPGGWEIGFCTSPWRCARKLPFRVEQRERRPVRVQGFRDDLDQALQQQIEGNDVGDSIVNVEQRGNALQQIANLAHEFRAVGGGQVGENPFHVRLQQAMGKNLADEIQPRSRETFQRFHRPGHLNTPGA